MVQTIKRHSNLNARILEIGCGVGRNLKSLLSAGFYRLEGIEINQEALRVLKTSYPDLAQKAKLYNASIEEVIKTFQDGEFDVVFTMAVLEHIHKDNEWCFHEIARITKTLLITIEDEFTISPIHFPRNYKKIFQSLGLRQIEEFKGNPSTGLGRNFVARIFEKTSTAM